MNKLPYFIVPAVGLLLCALLFSCGSDFKVSWTPVSPAPSVTAGQTKIVVYIENSGSMDGYMCEGAELKDAVYGYVSTLRSYADTLELNYINTTVVPYAGTLQHFVRDLNPATFRQVGGNRSTSDIGDMFEQILARQEAGVVSIFVSDCILDVPQGLAADYLTNRQIDIRNAFVSKLHTMPSLGVVVLRLMSTFSGDYYYDHGKERLTAEQRPYYMWVIGDKHLLAELSQRVPVSEIKHGVSNYFAFTQACDVPFTITNQYGKEQNPCVVKKPTRGVYTIKVRADLSSTLLDDALLLQSASYRTQNPAITPTAVSRTGDSQHPFTHEVTLEVPETVTSSGECLQLTVPYEPAWLADANDSTGTNIRSHLTRTTGISNIIGGVAEAYSDHHANRDYRAVASIRFAIQH